MTDAVFDLEMEEFCRLAEKNRPSVIQLNIKVDACCTPLQLYSVMKMNNGGACKYSYLLESVEKEQRHARFSFVGSDPCAVFTVKDRAVSLEYHEKTSMIRHIIANLAKTCRIRENGNGQAGLIEEDFDTFDAVRSVFPARDAALLNCTAFGRQTFLGGLIGFNSYDLVYDCWLDRPASNKSEFPDVQFALINRTAVFDHMTNAIHVVLTPFVAEDDDASAIYLQAHKDAEHLIALIKKAKNTRLPEAHVQSDTKHAVSNMSRRQYEDAVTRARRHIIDGDIFQVVPSRRYEMLIEETPLEVYRKLREVNPSPYMYLFEFNGVGIIGASPETLMTVHNRKVIINPIAGTCPRGSTPEDDDRLALEMLSDEKERAEHVMLVDLGRNDVRMVSRPGSVKVEDFMSVLKYSHVQHIESTVTGLLRDECDQFDATRAIFPAGTLSGAPKIRAMEIIDELECSARGPYGGGVGYYAINGDADFAIVIRTVIMKHNNAYIQAGAGIVADSDPTKEYYETERKMAAMMKALGEGV